MLLSLKNVSVQYGKSEAIHGVSLEVEEGSTTGLIGANGAGKSTIMKVISGLHPIGDGEIWFRDRRIDRLPGHDIVHLGIVQVPEGRRLFPQMSVMENIRIGAYLRKDKTAIKKDLERVWQRFPRLKERRNQRAETLSGGEQQMLAIGRALMASPKLLLLDEPSLGLAPLMVNNLAKVIRDINKEGISVFIVEQNASLAFDITQQVYVLEVGRVVLKGRPEDITHHPLVRKAFLGA